ncbi:hypothetical protein [Sabulicella glaciei]|uniref:Uncharacterized protein n=1 Tax=Sabulicella glaciei TaxID=2984948 RepID=A0ABT3NTC6_9PROT|nr:hypothetical protein [Roseococcus sp. MDT2-1-1]MCW8085417.1 hypothetical protein [Roseococcus sp. MDT2-1-1]
MRLKGLFRRDRSEEDPAPAPPDEAPAPIPFPALPGPPRALPDPVRDDALLAAALGLCWRRGVLFAWNDLRRVARGVLLCRQAGARRAHVAQPWIPSEADEVLLEEARRLEMEEEAVRILAEGRAAHMPALGGSLDCDAPRPWWLRAPHDHPDLREMAGGPELVLDGSQLIHWPDPVARLRSLAATGARHVVLETPVIRSEGALRRAGYTPGALWHATGMTPAQSAAMAEFWAESGVALDQYRRFPHGFSLAEARSAGLGGQAWWSFTDEAGLRRLLRASGFALRSARPVWDGRSLVIVAEREA